MSNELQVNKTKFQSELRGNTENIQNEVRVNYEEFENKQWANSGECQNEARAKQEDFQIEPRANHVKISNEQLVLLIRAGENEADYMLQLWQQNKGFIAKMAMKYSGYAEKEDLGQEGYIGLCEAVRHYKVEQGVPFISYAAFWIKQSMRRYIENCSSVVRIPTHARGWIQKYQKSISEYRKYYGNEPSESVLCALLGVSYEKLQAIKESVRMGQIRSVNEALGDSEDELTVGDSIQSDENVELDVVSRMDYQNMKEQLWKAVDSLSKEQSTIIQSRFFKNRTLKETGEIMGITAEVVRHQQSKAMRELRKPRRSRGFQDYYEAYLQAASSCHIGVSSFQRTWMSEVERDVIGI